MNEVREIDDLLMRIVTEDNPILDDYEWTIVAQALEYLKEGITDPEKESFTKDASV